MSEAVTSGGDHFEQLMQACAMQGEGRLSMLVRDPLRTALPALLRRSGIALPITTRTFFQVPMKVILPEVVSTHIYRYGYFEKDLTVAMTRLIKPGNVFFDVGGHFGYASVLASTLVGPTGRIVAFEPTPSTRAVLQENLSPIPQARIEPLAVWKSSATIEMNDFGVVHSAFNSFGAARALPKAEGKSFSVSCVDLDSYVKSHGVIPHFIKIDAESAEMPILQGAAGLLQEHKPTVVLEVGDFDLPGVAASRDLVTFMRGLGYSIYNIKSFGFTPHEARERYDSENLVFSARALS